MTLKEVIRLHQLWLNGDATGKKANLSGASLIEANLRGADLRWANLSGADLRWASLIEANLSDIPVVENLDAKILKAISNGQPRIGERDDCLPSLEMGAWHSCDTTHCRAGWAITLAGKEGAELEAKVGSCVAGALIYQVSTGSVPNFYASNADALREIQESAGAGGSGAEAGREGGG